MEIVHIRRCALGAASVIALATALGIASGAAAQETGARQATNDDTTVNEVVVVGSRASQQSAIERKKRAKTPTDSIVADDVGSFPDRNVNEAISRIAGTALGRNDFGEGESVTVRGNGPDLTRVELDGLGVQSTNGLALNADSARSADLRELPADLIKSVDVIKGSTADMTEGALGGTIKIQTRSGLDFSKPYFSMRAGAQANTLGRKITPDFNLIASRKFLDDRLGIIVSGTYSDLQTNAHAVETTSTNNRSYARAVDFDNSPEKTFSFNPETVGTDEADIVFANSLETPRSLVTKSASAQSKADCLTLFPHNPTASNAARTQRIQEQQTCLGQWNDYTPSNLRSFMNTQRDERISIDARVDYRVTDDFIVYGKYNRSDRTTDDFNRSRSLGFLDINSAGSFQDTTTGYPRTRSASRPGYYLWDPQAINAVNNNAVLGNVLNAVPGSVTVDDKHNVTQMTLNNLATNINQISNVNDTKTSYMQFGGEYRGDRLEIDFMAGRVKASSSRQDMRTDRTYRYGSATVKLEENGLWSYALPAGYDENDPNNYVQLNAPLVPQAAVAATVNNPATPAYTIAQMPLTSPSMQVTFSPTLGESTEENAKFDLSYNTRDLIPFFTRFKTGMQYRAQNINRWGGGGYVAKEAIGTFGQPGYVPPIVVPTANVRGSLRACQETAGSQGPGGLSCNFGFVPATNLSNVRSGVDTLTAQQLLDLIKSTVAPKDSEFFHGAKNRGDLPPAWDSIDTEGLFRQLGAWQFINFDCLKRCTANDGQVYDQPATRTREVITNLYFLTEFEQDLRWGLKFDGNVGVRGVKTEVQGTAVMQLNAVRVTPAYDPNNPGAPGGTVTQTFRQNVTLANESQDWLPSYNFNLWGFEDTLVLRYYGGRTVARPNINRLLPGGTCTIDERNQPGFDDDLDGTNGCTGRVGNPGLEPFTANNSSVNLEWYPNRDTTISLAHHDLHVKIGQPVGTSKTGKLFAGSDQVDPVTGQPVSDLDFTYPTWENGPGFKRSGWEFIFKTAFTRLPGLLRHTGVDYNISTLTSGGTSLRDPVTGDSMKPPGESDYYTNLSVWYDDGRLNARIAYQNRTEQFSCISPCGGNSDQRNYPGDGYTNIRLAYNPGSPRFVDETTYIDAKLSYNISKRLQIYVEGRNLTKEQNSVSNGEYEPFAGDIPKVWKVAYSGQRFMTGFVFKY